MSVQIQPRVPIARVVDASQKLKKINITLRLLSVKVECQNIPRQVAKQVPVENCQNVPKEECKKVIFAGIIKICMQILYPVKKNTTVKCTVTATVNLQPHLVLFGQYLKKSFISFVRRL